MNKKCLAPLALVLVLLMALPMLGCSLVSVNEEKNRAQVVAKVGGTEIKKGEFIDEFTQAIQYVSMFGYDPTASEAELNDFQDMVLESLIRKNLERYQADLKGYKTLTEEELKEVDSVIEDEEAYIFDTALEQAKASLGAATEEEINKKAEELFPKAAEQIVGKAFKREEFRTWLKEMEVRERLVQKMREEFDATITVSDEEVHKAFDEKLNTDKTQMEEDPGAYKQYQESAEKYGGDSPFYAPEGYVRVKYIKLVPEDELPAELADNEAELAELEAELGKLSLSDEVGNAERIKQIKAEHTSLKAQTLKLRTEHFEKSRLEAEKAYEKLQSGTSFDEVMKEFSKDSDFMNYDIFKEKGKLLSSHESAIDWSSEIKAAVLKLSEVGSYTGIIEDSEGFHILQYVGKEPAGSREFSQYEQTMRETVLSAKQAEEWEALLSEWLKDTTLVTRYLERIRDVGKKG
ncbi:MAG TPA: SurA N-terminal domain-containing protein [Clostridia bacterium]|nr:SurA N-terminal domain-containing protein [Clostridia bacterium]